jgi:hypothetical protein
VEQGSTRSTLTTCHGDAGVEGAIGVVKKCGGGEWDRNLRA